MLIQKCEKYISKKQQDSINESQNNVTSSSQVLMGALQRASSRQKERPTNLPEVYSFR